MVDSIVDELEKMPEVAAYYAVWNDLRDTLEGYYKSKSRQHNALSQQKEFRVIKNAIIQEAERLRQQMEQESSQGEEPSAEETSRDASTNPTLADENTSSPTSHSVRLPSEYLLNSTIRLFHQMVQIFRENAAPPSNPMASAWTPSDAKSSSKSGWQWDISRTTMSRHRAMNKVCKFGTHIFVCKGKR